MAVKFDPILGALREADGGASSANAVTLTGNQSVSGEKTFIDKMILSGGISSPGSGRFANEIFGNGAGLSFSEGGDYNTVVGYHALRATETGNSNVAIGAEAMADNVNGAQNVAVGYQALYKQIAGTSNIAIGYIAMTEHISGMLNVAIGDEALRNNEDGEYNVAIGASSLVGNVTGSNNVAIGSNAGKYETESNSLYIDNQDRLDTAGEISGALVYGKFNVDPSLQNLRINGKVITQYGCSSPLTDPTAGLQNEIFGALAGNSAMTGNRNAVLGNSAFLNNETGQYNIAIGTDSLAANTDGFSNIAIGDSTLLANTVGAYNVAIGDSSMLVSVSANNNTAIGANTLYSSRSGNNTAIGFSSLMDVTSGAYNTSIGANAGSDITIGGSNVVIGADALHTNKTGSRNIAIGAYAGAYETGDDALYIDNRNRTNTAGDKAGAIIYGTFNATPASQTLRFNADCTMFGDKIIRLITLNSAPTPTTAGRKGDIGYYAGYAYLWTADAVVISWVTRTTW